MSNFSEIELLEVNATAVVNGSTDTYPENENTPGIYDGLIAFVLFIGLVIYAAIIFQDLVKKSKERMDVYKFGSKQGINIAKESDYDIATYVDPATSESDRSTVFSDTPKIRPYSGVTKPVPGRTRRERARGVDRVMNVIEEEDEEDKHDDDNNGYQDPLFKYENEQRNN